MKARYSLLFPLLLVFLLSAPSTGLPAEKTLPHPDKVLLSLRIAKARKEQRGINYYKSVARQIKMRRAAMAPHPSSERSPSGSSRGAR